MEGHLKALKSLVQGEVRVNEPMACHTTWQIGGPAEVFLEPTSVEEVRQVVRYTKANNLPLTVIGNGSNLLVADDGIPGVTMHIGSGMNWVKKDGLELTAGAGVLLPHLARIAQRAGLGGLAFAAGIPASLGGAVIMNAGAHGGNMAQLVKTVWLVNDNGDLMTLDAGQITFAYRFSSLQQMQATVVQVNLACRPEAPATILAAMQENINRRRQAQPWGRPSAGSVFKNPPGEAAGRLIERAGAKGMTVGGAQVSPVHANFIINLGGATAADVLTLIGRVQDMVFEKFGIKLELEVRVLQRKSG